jgi:hypothetical protein
VSARADSKTVVTSAAYLLFYRRRTDPDHPLGGPQLQDILLEPQHDEIAVDSEAAQDSRDSSPVTGEGRRLGDSSHNGLSSASQVGPGHRVGAGPAGSGQDESRQTQGLSAATGSPSTMIHPLGASGMEEALPPYDDLAPDEAVADVTSGHFQWEQPQSWSFQHLTPQQPTNSEDGDMFGDRQSSNDSTRVEGGEASPGPSFGSDMDDEGSIHHNPGSSDTPQYSSQAGPIMHHEDFTNFTHVRTTRESAPPPDEVPIAVESGRAMSMPMDTQMGDDDDDPPVAELRADPMDNELKFHNRAT